MDLVKELKENDQDFEWYPTTNEILESMHTHFKSLDEKPYAEKGYSLLDIGAGNGKVFNTLNELIKLDNTEYKNYINKQYAIEKSKILCESLDKDIFIIGTDFLQQTLIDKKVDIIFSNPPYKEYSQWTEKIIKESKSVHIYLVIPQRWKNQHNIKSALKKREAEYKIIGEFDFEDSEDRKARAKVDLVYICTGHSSRYNSYSNIDAFDVWFEEHFDFDVRDDEVPDYEKQKAKKININSIVKKENLIYNLEKFYQEDLKHLLENYKSVEQLDHEILDELNVNVNGIKEAIKLKIKNLKDVYWKELFDNLSTITDRLTLNSRDKLLETLTKHTSIDFTANNAYAVIMWAIKNANSYYDDQLKELYMRLSGKDNVRLYKSNNRIIEDGWRYQKNEMSHYSLDYRIIQHCRCSSFKTDGMYYHHYHENGLYSGHIELIEDIFTIAINLGFKIKESSKDRKWKAGNKEFFYIEETLFCEIKAFKNGNLHFKFNQEFMKKLNIEAARLNKWIKSPQHATEEFDISIEDANKMFNSNIQISKKNILLLKIK